MGAKLDAALAWAGRGFRVFPLQADLKLPCDQGWTTSATTDPDVVRSWWTDPVTGAERDHNIGVLTTDLVVADVDTKAGKPGLDTFVRLGLEFDTLTVRTPTGGYHLYFRGIGREVGNAPLGPGIDVRSKNGFVVAPGSTIGGVPYVVEFDQLVADFPVELRPLLRAPRARRDAAGVSVELDQPESVELAAHWLRREAAPAVQGENGDDATYRTACRVRDFGVSEGVALDLMLDEWNDRCEPPWSVHEVRLKVENAYRYATGEAGSASPAAAFDGVVHVPHPGRPERDTISVPVDAGSLVRFGNMMREEDIPPRPWVVEGLLMEKTVSLVVAPGGAGKSLLSLIVGAHLAVGRPIWGYEVSRPGNSVIYNAEDDLAEVSRRLNSVCKAYDLDVDVVSSRVSLLGTDDIELQLTKGVRPPTLHEAHYALLLNAAADPDVVMLSIDPLVEVHTGQENDAVEMRMVMGVLRSVARRSNVSVIGIQHTAKGSQQAGNQDAARGSTAITNASRVVLTLTPAEEKDCVLIGAPLQERDNYVQLRGAKASYAARGRTRWLKWTSSKLTNGDSVGVLVEHDADAAHRAMVARVADEVVEALRDSGVGAVPLPAMADMLRDRNPAMVVPEASTTFVKRLQQMFEVPVYAPAAGLRVFLRASGSGVRGQHFVVG